MKIKTTASIIFLSSAIAWSAHEAPKDLYLCKMKQDCIIVDINCGRASAVNKKYPNYNEAIQGCDASLDFLSQKQLYTVGCLLGKCVLVSKKKSN